MWHDTRIEQCRGLERIFVEKISARELALDLREYSMVGQRRFHFRGARLEDLQQVAVTAEEVLQNVGQLPVGRLGIERENPFDDMVGAGLVRRIEVARLCRRLEWPNDDTGRVRPQLKGLAFEEGRLRQNGLDWLKE
ncbi:hypothetical protein ACVW0I_006253 [Bradyrhizobium sp. LM6.11]